MGQTQGSCEHRDPASAEDFGSWGNSMSVCFSWRRESTVWRIKGGFLLLVGLCGGGASSRGFSDPSGVCWVSGIPGGLFAFGGAPVHPLRDDRLLLLFSSQELLGREWGWESGMAGNCLLANSFGSEAPWSSCLLKLWSVSRGVFKVRMWFLTALQTCLCF